MYEISLAEGFGPIQFGATPNEVKSAWDSDLYYEDWMGGNLENFLYFKGLLVGFRGEVEGGPTEKSHVCMFRIKTVHSLMIWGRDITQATKQELESLLTLTKMQYTVLPNGILQCANQELQFHFNESGVLDEVYFAN
ncbi:hypothetical protein [Alteromonas sp. C1M14]|uniref:hypothetical protein n=1 Tax=Alteromonas sp. C1M14 TaxID=2841567 RepID=UPI001C07F784|nr:hypothetical protein [Alteromonas sp. C1M14]MBU2978755.1 hypothetical protein [Alteromonas sp. C1M14]